MRVVFRVGSGKEGEARARWVEVGVQEQGRQRKEASSSRRLQG